MRIQTLFITGLLALLLVLSGCKSSNEQQPLRLQGQIFGTYWFVTYLDDWDKNFSEQLNTALVEELNKVDLAMSTYKPNSELNQLNQAPVGQWVKLSPNTFEVLAMAQDVAAATQGAFDVTLGGLVNLWNFGPEKHDQPPTQEAINQALEEVGYQYLELDPADLTARRNKNSFVDLSGIAKGYAVDKLVEKLHSLGGKNFLVNIGGEIYAAGLRGEEQKWRIGIEVPNPHQQQAQHLLEVSNTSVATSGGYRNFYEVDGQEYSHTLNPLTGKPITHQLKSVTILHPSNAIADAWATALMASDPDTAFQLAETNKIKALFITQEEANFKTFLSSSMRSYLGSQASAKLTQPAVAN